MKKALLIIGILGILFGGFVVGIGLAYAGYDGLGKAGDTLFICRIIGGLIIIPSLIVALVGLFLTLKDFRKNNLPKNRIATEWYLIVYVGTLLLGVSTLGIDIILSKIFAPVAGAILGGGGYSSYSLIPVGLLLFLFVFILMGIILHLVLLTKLWAAINDGKSFTTPGKAIGFLLVPVLNIIWAGLVWIKFPSEYNKYIERNSMNAPKISSGVFVLYGILVMIPFIGLLFPFVLPFVIYKGFDAINNILEVVKNNPVIDQNQQPIELMNRNLQSNSLNG